MLNPAAEKIRRRIVLLTRGSEDWWRSLKSAPDGVGSLLSGSATSWHVLKPVAPTVEERNESFDKSRRHFATLLGLEGGEKSSPPDIDAKLYDQILLLQMAALASLESVPVKGDSGILEFVLNRERRFWVYSMQSRNLDPILLRGIGQCMAALTLGGGAASESQAMEVVDQIPELKDQPFAVRSNVIRLLHDMYPGRKWIEPILPDLLGEQLVAEEFNPIVEEIVFGPPDTATVSDGKVAELEGSNEGLLRELEARDAEVTRLENQFRELKLRMFDQLLDQVETTKLPDQSSEIFAAVLFLDLKGFSKMPGDEQEQKVQIVRQHASGILATSAIRPTYTNTWGDAIVAVFIDPNESLHFALRLQSLLEHDQLPARIGMGYGKVNLAFDSLLNTQEAKGPVMSEAARLEPMADPYKILVTEALRFCPRISVSKFVFIKESRPLKKSFGSAVAGQMINCFSVRKRTD